MTKTRIQNQRPAAKGKHQRGGQRRSVRENPPYGQNWGAQVWPGPITNVPFGLWNFETQTVVPPGSAAIRLNNVNASQVTAVFVNETLAGGTDPIAGIANGEKIRLFYIDDTTKWVEYTVTAQADAGAYRNYTVTYSTASVPFTTPVAGTKVGLQEWASPPGDEPGTFDPGNETVDGVKAHVDGLALTGDELRAEIQRILDAERANKNRVTLVEWLDAKLGVV